MNDTMLVNSKYISIPVDEVKLKERNRELSILLEITNLHSSSKNLEEHLTGALSKVLEYFDLDSGRIYLKDSSAESLHLAASKGIDFDGLERVSLSGSFSGKAFRNKTFIAQHVSDLEDQERARLLLSKGSQIIICVPLIVRDVALGVMNLARSKGIQLNHEKIDLLTAIGNQIAIAVENAILYKDLEQRIETLRKKEEMIKFFAYSISHDLRSPAVGMYGIARRLIEKHANSLNEDGKAYCGHILKTAEHMVSLTEKINAFVLTKEAPLDLEKVNTKEITDALRAEFSELLEARKIHWVEPDNLPEIVADRLALIRVFRNLIDNAFKYGGKTFSEIMIGYEQRNSFHVFSVSDNGVEIKAEEKERIFELFQRNETSRGVAGSGLGLAIVKETAERHGGRAWMETGKAGGKSFHVSIARNLSSV